MIRLLLASVGVCSVMVGAASAADMMRPPPPIAMPVKAPLYAAPLYIWSGPYLGVNVGYGMSRGSGTMNFGGAPGTWTARGNGVLGGIQAGYNWQINSFVVGVEADIDASAAKGPVTGTAGANSFTASAKVPWFGTARARLGYAYGTWMPYLTAGMVMGRGTLTGTRTNGPPYDVSSGFTTWTIGGGLETALWGRWTAKGEYLYINSPNKVPVPPTTTRLDGKLTSHIVRLGVNYRF